MCSLACLEKHAFDSLRCIHVAIFFLELSASKFGFNHIVEMCALCAFTVSSRIMQAAKAKPTNVAIQTTPIAIPRAGTKKRAAAQTKNGYLGQTRQDCSCLLFSLGSLGMDLGGLAGYWVMCISWETNPSCLGFPCQQ